ncbi:4360_t:CDS:2 [Entrophospora sp. SA101]|nr:4360_t:CDS:2 [Entrophospora sp. SA101]
MTDDFEFLNIEHIPMHSYYGHDDEDGTCIIHSLRNANYIRTLCPFEDDESSVEYLCITKDANIVIYMEYKNEYFLHTYSINGKLLNSMQLSVKIEHMISSTESNSIVTTTIGKDERSFIRIYDVLRTIKPLQFVMKSNLSQDEYHRLSEETMEKLYENLESLGEETDIDDYDVEYSCGSMGTYVINKQPPNKQIWLSSPVSGPKRYDYDFKYEKWFYHHENSTLDGLLSDELSQIFKRNVKLSF